MMEPAQSSDYLIYFSINQIFSDQVIESGATIVFDAGDSIELTDGFEVEIGAVITALIGGFNIQSF